MYLSLPHSMMRLPLPYSRHRYLSTSRPQFQSCALKWKFLEVPLPPVGEGWGEQVYLDDTLRIQRDSRGDTLVARRV